MVKIPQYLLSLAGEYRVCSELNKRGIFATITYGNRKSVDVYAISDTQDRALKIEVKTSQQRNFLTGIFQEYHADGPDDPAAPDFWVLVQTRPIEGEKFSERFFVLTHREIWQAQSARNQAYVANFKARHGKPFDLSTGVPNVTVDDVKEYEDQWSKIVERFHDRSG